jgi:hypothetical protein
MKLIHKVVDALWTKCEEKNLKLHDFAEVPEHIRCLKISLDKSDLSKEY